MVEAVSVCETNQGKYYTSAEKFEPCSHPATAEHRSRAGCLH